jgi:hypothetical protein
MQSFHIFFFFVMKVIRMCKWWIRRVRLLARSRWKRVRNQKTSFEDGGWEWNPLIIKSRNSFHFLFNFLMEICLDWQTSGVSQSKWLQTIEKNISHSILDSDDQACPGTPVKTGDTLDCASHWVAYMPTFPIYAGLYRFEVVKRQILISRSGLQKYTEIPIF